jgi:alpha-L-arabinofuranosidase
MPRFVVCALGMIVLFGLLPGNADAQSDQVVYGDSLGSGWQDWSWCSRDLNSTDFVHSGTQSAKVTYTAGFQGFYMHHTAFDGNSYTTLTFWINGGASTGRSINVAAQLNEVSQSSVPLNNYVEGGSIAAGSWRRVSIPLSDLGVSHATNLNGFWLQDSSGGPQPSFYIDDITFLSAPPPAVVNLNIDSNNVKRTVDGRLFGVAGAIWDDKFATSATISFLTASHTRITRFPGGSLSNNYHWRTNTTDNNTWTWATDFDEFAGVAQSINAQAFISVNYGTGTAQEAADWVRYSNITKNYGFKYWEIGNENYGSWEADTRARAHDPVIYAMAVRDYMNAMKSVDPTIKVGVVVTPGEDSFATYRDHPVTNPRTGQSHNGWTAVMLATLHSLGVTPDFIIHHRYEQPQGQEDDATLLQAARTWPNDAADLRGQLNDYLGVQGATTELVCTENNSVSSGPGKQTTSLVNGLYYADSFGQVLQTEFKAFTWWIFRNGRDAGNNNSDLLYGWRRYGDYGMVSGDNEPYPVYYVSKLVSTFVDQGDQVIAATSDYNLLSVYAVKRATGGVSLLVINKSRSGNLAAHISLNGVSPQTNATTYSYGIPQDEAARTGTGSPDIVVGSFGAASSSFDYSFPSYSVTVIALATEAACAPTISSSSRFFGIAGGEDHLNVTAATSCEWTAASSASWIEILSGSAGMGAGSVAYSVKPNDTGSARKGTITVGSQVLTVVQDGNANCSFSLSADAGKFKAAGGAGEVDVACDPRCAWQASTDSAWLSITSVDVGVGNSAISFAVAPNTTGAKRKGRITIAGQVFKVTQKK